MPIAKHYFIEQTKEGKYAVRAENADRASSFHDTQAEAIAEAKRLDPNDHPDVERVRNLPSGGRDKWRSANEALATNPKRNQKEIERLPPRA